MWSSRCNGAALMTNMLKGSLVGFSAALLIAIAMALTVAGGMQTATPIVPLERPLDPLQAFVIALGAGLVPGVGFGALLGCLRIRGTPRARAITFALVGLLFVGLGVPFWPDLALCAVPIASLHAVVLAAWTRVR